MKDTTKILAKAFCFLFKEQDFAKITEKINELDAKQVTEMNKMLAETLSKRLKNREGICIEYNKQYYVVGNIDGTFFVNEEDSNNLATFQDGKMCDILGNKE